jgi:hypothetical protein
VFSDFAFKHSHTSSWQDIKNFDISEPISGAAFVRDGVDDLHKLIDWLLNSFYQGLTSFGKPVVLFAGPSMIKRDLANKYGIVSVEPDWCSLLVPEFKPSYVGCNLYLGWASELLIDLFPQNKQIIQEQFVELMAEQDARRNLFVDYPELFAYHHPTAKGNVPMAKLLKEKLWEI